MVQRMMMGRVAALLLSAVFAVLFTAGGYWAGLRPLAETLYAAWSVRHWQPIPAQVLDAQLRKHADTDGGTTYQALTRYRYETGGKLYEGQRIGLDVRSGADNVGDWQENWYRTLQHARQTGASITVWVHPQKPEQALIDPSVRWRLQIFRLPFALVFTGVGLVAGWIFVRLLTESPSAPEEEEPQSSLAKGHLGLWFFALFWCGLSFPIAALLWSDRNTPLWTKAFIALFVAIGFGLAWAAAVQSRKVWVYRGLSMTALPAKPRAGQPVEVTLVLPPRATHQAARGGADTLQLRLVQYRVDESSSGSPERAVETLDAQMRQHAGVDGSLRLVGRFTLPEDAPAHGARRSGERVDWRVELLRAGRWELAYDLLVQAAMVNADASALAEDRFDRRAQWAQVRPIVVPEAADVASGDTEQHSSPSALWPAGIRLLEGREAWSLEFSQTPWRWSAALALGVLMVEWWASGRIHPSFVTLPHTLGGMVWMVHLVAWALHAATRRWTLQVRDDGIAVQRRSWLWTSTVVLPGEASLALVHKPLFSTGSGASQQTYHAVWCNDVTGALQRITPGLRGADAAQAVGRAIARAWQERRGGFAAGMQRGVPASSSRPAAGCLLLLGLVVVSTLGPHTLRWGEEPVQPSGPPTARVWAPADARLLDAQNAGDTTALAQALSDGANPNLLADSGSSMLMLAAHRGKMAHVELLLAAGAQVDLRQTLKDSERGDTALLRALYGGHLDVAQRLVKAGASLQARNRWDWGPVHMAAQSGCVSCLAWLKAHGQSLSEPALASRGETPAMLAAAKGQLAVLEWLQREGVDLWARDSQGKNVLDWARFRQKQETEQWLLKRQPAGT